MRRLLYAVIASLLVHLLILWPSSLRLLTKDTPSLLQATLRVQQQPPAEHLPPRPPPRAVMPAPTLPATPVLKPERQELEQPRLSPVPQSLAAPPDPAMKPAPGLAPALAAAVTTNPAMTSAGGALATEANASGEVLDGLRGYRLAVAIQARRFKRYPAQAMASGWAGSAEIRIEVGRDGQPRTATVVRSSGHEPLDRAALAMIDAGALRVRLPESLRGKAFAVVLPVVFNLEDD